MYVLEPEEQHQLINTLTLVEWDINAWTGRYVDAAGNDWTLYYPFSASQGGGPAFLRRGEPPSSDADVPEWVVGLLRSKREDDADGAASDLIDRPETWGGIFDRIEAEQGSLPAESVSVFIEVLGVTDPSNRRPILNKSLSEIEIDASHFGLLSRRASNLLGAG